MSDLELKPADILAVERTRMASERTLMAWVRTSVSMISFGFTIAKALEYAERQGVVKGLRATAPERVGLILIVLATVSLSLGCLEHRSFVRSLPAIGARRRQWDLTSILASVIIVFGLLILVNILFHVGPV